MLIDLFLVVSYSITSYEDVMLLLRQGTGSRKVAATSMNERSSRSHCIFKLAIESRAISGDVNVSEASDEGTVIVSQLNLVDLAGSERASQTGAQGSCFVGKLSFGKKNWKPNYWAHHILLRMRYSRI